MSDLHFGGIDYGGKLSRVVYLAPLLNIDSYTHLFQSCISNSHDASQIKLYTLSFSSVCLVAEAGGKLSRAVCLALPPHLGIVS